MTYSVGITGAPADNDAVELFAKATNTQTLTIDDANGATHGDQRNAMMLNTQFLCLGTDGQQAYYTYDAERSNPRLGIRVLKRV